MTVCRHFATSAIWFLYTNNYPFPLRYFPLLLAFPVEPQIPGYHPPVLLFANCDLSPEYVSPKRKQFMEVPALPRDSKMGHGHSPLLPSALLMRTLRREVSGKEKPEEKSSSWSSLFEYPWKISHRRLSPIPAHGWNTVIGQDMERRQENLKPYPLPGAHFLCDLDQFSAIVWASGTPSEQWMFGFDNSKLCHFVG